MRNKSVKLFCVNSSAKLPTKGTSGSAYWDLYAAEQSIVAVGCVELVSTGWCVEVPQGYFLDLRPRSGLASYGVTINNSPGVVDADYRGELKVIVINHGLIPYVVRIGDRIAQCALMPVVLTSFQQVLKELSSTKRGTRGYGSTGR